MLNYGRATINGIGAQGTVVYTGGASVPQDHQITTGIKIGDSANIQENLDGNGELLGAIVNNKRRRITIDFYPVAVPGTNTQANALAALQNPENWSKVVLAAFDEAFAGQINGDWIYEQGGEPTRDDKGRAKMSLTLFRPLTSPKTVTELTTAAA